MASMDHDDDAMAGFPSPLAGDLTLELIPPLTNNHDKRG
jgi:hypothetical protein